MLWKLILMNLFFFQIYAQDQPDKSFCDIDAITPDPDNLPPPVASIQYQAHIEKNKGGDKLTEEIREYYDGTNNVGLVKTRFAGLKIDTYAYADKNLLLLVENDVCRVLNLNESYDATPFYVVTNSTGSEHIVSPLNLFSKLPDLKVVYIGAKRRVRGIPVKEWVTCVYDKKLSSTLKIIIAVSDDRSWLPATDQASYVPVEFIVKAKNRITGKETEEIGSITEFRPKLYLQEEDYFLHEGVYCQGKPNFKPLPEIPIAFSYWAQVADQDLDSNGYSGKLGIYRNEHDFLRKLNRVDFIEKDQPITIIHDYNAGLSYKINQYFENCSVTELDSNNNGEAQNPNEFFNFEKEPPFQYSGMKRVRGINTDVWVAPRKFMNYSATWEWHFMTDYWTVQESNAMVKNEPVLLVITANVPVLSNSTIPQTKKLPIYFHVTNFDRTRLDLYDFDLSICEHFGQTKHLRFLISKSEKYSLMKANQGNVKDAILGAIQNVAQVSLLRISRLETIYDNETVYVTFSLFDKPRFYGNPNRPDELTLNDAYSNLKSAFEKNEFLISFFDESSQIYGVKADKDSLVDLDSRDGRYVFIDKLSGETIGYTGGSVAGFVIGFLILGLTFGFGVGYLFIIKRSSPIALPGPLSFFNPNFKSEA